MQSKQQWVSSAPGRNLYPEISLEAGNVSHTFTEQNIRNKHKRKAHKTSNKDFIRQCLDHPDYWWCIAENSRLHEVWYDVLSAAKCNVNPNNIIWFGTPHKISYSSNRLDDTFYTHISWRLENHIFILTSWFLLKHDSNREAPKFLFLKHWWSFPFGSWR